MAIKPRATQRDVLRSVSLSAAACLGLATAGCNIMEGDPVFRFVFETPPSHPLYQSSKLSLGDALVPIPRPRPISVVAQRSALIKSAQATPTTVDEKAQPGPTTPQADDETKVGDSQERDADLPGVDLSKLTPGDLVGLAPAQAAAMFGEPTQEILKAPARIWQYNATLCTLRLIFYRDILTERYRSLSYEIRLAEEGDADAERRCLADIVADKNG